MFFGLPGYVTTVTNLLVFFVLLKSTNLNSSSSVFNHDDVNDDAILGLFTFPRLFSVLVVLRPQVKILIMLKIEQIYDQFFCIKQMGIFILFNFFFVVHEQGRGVLYHNSNYLTVTSPMC